MTLKPGDTVTRLLSGKIPMKLKVTQVTDDLIICEEWTFDRKTGAEIDHNLQWGPDYGTTGSFLEVTWDS